MNEYPKYVKDLSIEQLQARIDELTRIRKGKERPVQDKVYTLTKLLDICEEYIAELEKDEEERYGLDDIEHYIFEVAMTTFYGNDVWIWINKQLS